MIKPIHLAAALLLAAAVPSAPAQAPGAATNAKASAQDQADLARISAYLNSIRTMKAEFMQVGPNSELDRGTVYVNKPGRMRFEYSKPSPYLIVSDGVSVAVGNSQLNTVDRYPLIENPLSIILDETINLAAEKGLTQIERKAGQISVTAERANGDLKGKVTMIFADPALELRQWVITDGQGQQTLVALQNIQTSVTLNPELFILKDVNKFADPREQ
ncbi:MAG TPA: hypothetical protein DCL54_09350 [Alphaproteobacteria bacterium]|nr:hypothetical protein [Alphaproteobacteria bacterium]